MHAIQWVLATALLSGALYHPTPVAAQEAVCRVLTVPQIDLRDGGRFDVSVVRPTSAPCVARWQVPDAAPPNATIRSTRIVTQPRSGRMEIISASGRVVQIRFSPTSANNSPDRGVIESCFEASTRGCVQVTLTYE